MHWITLTLIASFFFALENIVDKKIADSTKNTTSALFLMNASKIPAILILGIYWHAYIELDTLVIFWSIFIGLMATLTGFLYLKAFQYGDASTVMPMYELGPIWSLLLSFLILSEIPHTGQYIALIFLVLGGIIFSLQRDFFSGKSLGKFFNIALVFVLTASLGYNLMYVLSKLVILRSNLETFFFLQQVCYIVFSIVFSYYRSSGNSLREVSHISRKFLIISVAAQSIGIFAFVLYTRAFTEGTVSLVNALSSTQALFVILISAMLSFFVPGVLREDWDRFSMFQKAIATLCISIGVVLMYFVS